MPQMMPMNWIIMFSQTIIIITLILVFIYHMPFMHPNKTIFSFKSPKINWKW